MLLDFLRLTIKFIIKTVAQGNFYVHFHPARRQKDYLLRLGPKNTP